MRLPDLSSELTYRAVTGGGPGGQHVNRAATKVELRWNVLETSRFSESDRGRLAAKLASRLTSDGELVLTDHSSRSQHRNRERVTERVYELLGEALRRERKRKRTKPTNASKRRRLEQKRRRSAIKGRRGRVDY